MSTEVLKRLYSHDGKRLIEQQSLFMHLTHLHVYYNVMGGSWPLFGILKSRVGTWKTLFVLRWSPWPPPRHCPYTFLIFIKRWFLSYQAWRKVPVHARTRRLVQPLVTPNGIICGGLRTSPLKDSSKGIRLFLSRKKVVDLFPFFFSRQINHWTASSMGFKAF